MLLKNNDKNDYKLGQKNNIICRKKITRCEKLKKSGVTFYLIFLTDTSSKINLKAEKIYYKPFFLNDSLIGFFHGIK